MTFYHGLGMFIFNIVILFIASIIAYYIIREVDKKRRRKEYLEQLKGKRFNEENDTN